MSVATTIEPAIIFEDEHLLVLNKPPGMVVNRASSVKVQTLQDWVEEYYQDDQFYQQELINNQEFSNRSGMVHRLDKDTSGVLLWAKNAAIMHKLMASFKKREIHKKYLTLLHGLIEPPQGVVRVGIERHRRDRERFSVSAQGRPSETKYQLRQHFVGIDRTLLPSDVDLPPEKELKNIYQGFSLVECLPKTGRTHQIRVHMKFLHHPLVADERYSGRKRARADKTWCPRQWLHAAEISFQHPVSNKQLSFTAPLAADLQATLKWLRPRS